MPVHSKQFPGQKLTRISSPKGRGPFLGHADPKASLTWILTPILRLTHFLDHFDPGSWLNWRGIHPNFLCDPESASITFFFFAESMDRQLIWVGVT